MKNKTLAFIGIGAYILSVIASAEDLQGNPRMPDVLIAISGIITIVFVIIATLRLWKYAKGGAITFVSSFTILTAFEVIQSLSPLIDGNPVILLWSASKVIYFISSIWVVVKLFKLKDNEIIENK